MLFQALSIKQAQQGAAAPAGAAVRENSGAGLYGDYNGYGVPGAYGVGLSVGGEGYGMGVDGSMLESWPGAVAGVVAADGLRGELGGGGQMQLEGLIAMPAANGYFAAPMQYGHQQPHQHLRGAAHMVAVLGGGAPPVLPHPVLPRVPHGAAVRGAVVAGYMQGVAAGLGPGGALGRVDGLGHVVGVGAGAADQSAQVRDGGARERAGGCVQLDRLPIRADATFARASSRFRLPRDALLTACVCPADGDISYPSDTRRC